MIDDRHAGPQGHPTDAELVAWMDELEKAASGAEASAPASLAEHFETCDPCRARQTELERFWSALRAEPSAPSDEALAAQRDAILTAIEARPRKTARSAGPAVSSPTVRPIRRWLWVPMAAAAAAAAFLLLAPDRTVPPPPTEPDDRGQTLPVVAGAEEAAEEAFLEVVGSGSVTGKEPARDDPAADEMAGIRAALASLDAAAPVLTTEGSAIEDEFAALPAEDQETILDELSTMTFEL